MERFPIEPEELLPEEAHQVEVFYEEPQEYDTFEKKGKHKHDKQSGSGTAERTSLGSESQRSVVAWSMSRRDGMIHETQVMADGEVLESSRVDARALIGQHQLGGPGIHPISADAVDQSLRYFGAR